MEHYKHSAPCSRAENENHLPVNHHGREPVRGLLHLPAPCQTLLLPVRAAAAHQQKPSFSTSGRTRSHRCANTFGPFARTLGTSALQPYRSRRNRSSCSLLV